MADSRVSTILNVNDDEASLYANSQVLTRAGYRVIEARTGKDALRAAVREQSASRLARRSTARHSRRRGLSPPQMRSCHVTNDGLAYLRA